MSRPLVPIREGASPSHGDVAAGRVSMSVFGATARVFWVGFGTVLRHEAVLGLSCASECEDQNIAGQCMHELQHSLPRDVSCFYLNRDYQRLNIPVDGNRTPKREALSTSDGKMKCHLRSWRRGKYERFCHVSMRGNRRRLFDLGHGYWRNGA